MRIRPETPTHIESKFNTNTRIEEKKEAPGTNQLDKSVNSRGNNDSLGGRSLRKTQLRNATTGGGEMPGGNENQLLQLTSMTNLNLTGENNGPGGMSLTLLRPAVPPLNMHRLNYDTTPGGGGNIQTRSSRRADATKSVSTRSTKYTGIFSSSFDHFHSHNGKYYFA